MMKRKTSQRLYNRNDYMDADVYSHFSGMFQSRQPKSVLVLIGPELIPETVYPHNFGHCE